LEQGDVSRDAADRDGRTPISWAAGNGYEVIVKSLLGQQDAAPKAADNGGRIPLLWVARNGYAGSSLTITLLCLIAGAIAKSVDSYLAT